MYVWDEFSEFLPENRVPTSADFNTYPIQIFYFSDEAHERTVSTDILFGVMKMAQEKRLSQNNPLKIIVMSATLNAEKFSQYFKNCPILHVIGRQHTINVMHVTETEDDWQSAILQTVLKIHLETPPKYVIFVQLKLK